MRFLHSFAFMVANLVAFVLADYQPGDLKPLFETHEDHDQSSGGCSEWIHDLSEAYFIGCSGIHNAYTMSMKLAKPKGTTNLPADTWVRYANVFQYLFGVSMSDPTLPDTARALKKLQQSLKTMRTFCGSYDDLAAKAPWAREGHFGLFCTDNFLKHYECDDEVPFDVDLNQIDDDRKKPTIQAWTEGTCRPDVGVWYSTEWPANIPHFYNKAAIEESGRPICADDIRANTNFARRTMTFCPDSMNEAKTARTLDDVPVEPGYLLGEIRSLTTLWIHELCHLWLDWEDQPAMDVSGNVLTDGSKAYDPEQAMRLAKFQPERALENPDNLAYFVEAVLRKEWDWSTLKAEQI